MVNYQSGDAVLAADFRAIKAEAAGCSYEDVTITAAQMLTLNATPVTLVAAPGAGLALLLEGVVAFYDYNSAAYAGVAAGEDLAIRLNDASGTIQTTIETTGFLDQTSDQVRYAKPYAVATSGNVQITPVENQPLVAHMLTGEITTGNTPLKIRTYYSVIPTSL
jgi:hypothetical protein